MPATRKCATVLVGSAGWALPRIVRGGASCSLWFRLAPICTDQPNCRQSSCRKQTERCQIPEFRDTELRRPNPLGSALRATDGARHGGRVQGPLIGFSSGMTVPHAVFLLRLAGVRRGSSRRCNFASTCRAIPWNTCVWSHIRRPYFS
jgi:hypothetical protein